MSKILEGSKIDRIDIMSTKFFKALNMKFENRPISFGFWHS